MKDQDNKVDVSPSTLTLSAPTESVGDDDSIPKPFNLWWNPSLSWTDALLSYVISYIFDFSALDNQTLDPHSEPAATILTRLQQKMHDSSYGYNGRAAIRKWSNAAGVARLAEYSGTIPFQKDILTKWKILDDNYDGTDIPESIFTREEVRVLVRFPSTLLSPDERESSTSLKYSGCCEVNKLDLKSFAQEVPLVIQFHGGGQVIGTAHSELLIMETAELVSNFVKGIDKKGNTSATIPSADIVTISVEYGLSPKEPFPVAIMDSLSVVDYLLEENPSRKIHLSGISAGANISLVAGLESYRRYPGRILSIQAQCPMLNPAGDTMSYYMNQHVFPSTNWLRWCWRAYLGLDFPPSSKATPRSVEEALRDESNYETWKVWKETHTTALHRLIDPHFDLPEKLDSNDAPKIFVRINMGDPMYNDGYEFARAVLEKQAHVTLFSDKGIHCSPSIHNNADYQRIMSLWSKAVFAAEEL
jgi:acetyl esterase/lipase